MDHLVRQDLSVAGLRKGLAGERSGLFMEQMRIVKEMRDECRKTNQPIRPRFLVWENVFGAFSSGNPGGSDFQAVLEEICKIVKHDCPVVPIPKEGWPASGNLDGVGDDGTPFSISWRVHDAQYWGVPQRRRRIALVADFGGTSAPEILFESYSMSGNSKQSTKEGQGTSGDPANSSGGPSGSILGDSDRKQVDEFLAAVNENAPHQQDLIQSDLGVARTLACETHASGPHLTKTLVTSAADAKVYGICSFDSNAMKSDNPNSGVYEADSARTLDLNGGNPACNQGGMAIVQNSEPTAYRGDAITSPVNDSNPMLGDPCHTLIADDHNYVVQPDAVGCDLYNSAVTGDVAASLTAQGSLSAGGSGPSVIVNTPDGCLNPWDFQAKHIQPENGIAESLCAGESRYGGGESYVLQKEPVLLESNQNHATIQTDGISTTLPASMGEGGGYVPMVCIEGNGSRDSHKGDGYSESETMYTLNTVEQHAVAYGIDQQGGKGQANYTQDVAPTLAADSHGTPHAVAYGFPGQSGVSSGMPIVEEGTPAMVANQITNVAQPVTSADAYGVVAKGNGDAFINPNTHTSLSTGGGEPGQGYPCVLQTTPQTYQKTTGALMASGYSKLGTQEATNDMYVVQDPSAFITSESEDSVEPKVQSMEVFHCTSEENLAAPLKARDYKDPQVVAFEPGAASRVGGHVYVDGKAGTLRAEMGDNQQAICQGFDSYNGTVYSIDQGAGKSGCNFDVNKAPTLTTTHGGEPVVLNDQGGQQMDVTQGAMATLRAEAHEHEPIVFDPSRRHDCEPFGDVCETVQAAYGTGGNNVPFVLNPEQQSNEDSSVVFENHSQDTRYNELGEVCQTVSATWGMGGNNQPLEVKPQQAIVRRLTPLECERLQGFPDYWTHIGDWVDSSGKKHKDSDSPKYKALGNSIALPYWYWMAGNMVDQLKKSGISNPTMASLFDGIAGFPYVYIRHGCMPLWTSEIEEFPIAVCKKHFGDEDTGEVGDIEEYLKLPVNWVTTENTVDKATKPIIASDCATYNKDSNAKIVGSICASDYKGIRNQDIDDGKWIIQPPTEN